MSTTELILLGIVPDSKTSSGLAAELKEFGYATSYARSGYELIQKCLELTPSAIVLETGLEDCDTVRTSVWLKENSRTAGIPIFLLKDGAVSPESDRNNIDVLAEGIFSFTQGFPECGAEDIAAAIKEYSAKTSGPPVESSERPELVPSKEVVHQDIDAMFERGYLTNLLMLQFLELSSSLGEIDYFTKNLLQRLTIIFDCDMANLIWNFTEVTEYSHISRKIDMCLYEALRNKSDRLIRDAGWGNDPHGGKVTWGRKHLIDSKETFSDREFDGCSVSIEIKTHGSLKGILTVASRDAKKENWDDRVLRDITTMLSLIFSNFMLYQDLERKLERDTRIFQSFGELASISSLALGGFKSYLLQSLLILLDLCGTSKGTIIIFSADGVAGQTQALGAPDEFFTSLTSDGMPILDIVRNKPGINIFGEGITAESQSSPFDGDLVQNLVTLPLKCGDSMFGVIMVADARPICTVKEIEFLRIFATQISNQIYNHKTYSYEHLAKRSLEEQLSIARDIQVGLLPKGGIHTTSFEIFGRSDPAREVGGDFYDFYPLGQDRVGVAVADVSGKGLPASLLMSASMTTFRSIFEKNHKPSDFLRKANAIISTEFQSDKFLTTLYAMLEGSKMRLASGGHHPMIYYSSADDRFEFKDPSGMALGIIEDLEFEETQVTMYPGDIALLFTDGLCDARNMSGEQFGYKRIEDTIRELRSEGAEKIVNGLFDALGTFAEGMTPFDDTTVVVVVRKEDDDLGSPSGYVELSISQEKEDS